ncbi:MAG: hypothetical protein J6S69_11850, partial [Proteobacteria bacterium]|nr:hypothetical protein [Pseudomonadota bacterium]
MALEASTGAGVRESGGNDASDGVGGAATGGAAGIEAEETGAIGGSEGVPDAGRGKTTEGVRAPGILSPSLGRMDICCEGLPERPPTIEGGRLIPPCSSLGRFVRDPWDTFPDKG